ncbi:MAG: hypothetical protein AAFN77_23365 [Planctomycetota bacterium]
MDDIPGRFEAEGFLVSHYKNFHSPPIRTVFKNDSDHIGLLASLLNTNGFVSRISLASVWAQASEARQRFQVVAGQDEFGRLVAPQV